MSSYQKTANSKNVNSGRNSHSTNRSLVCCLRSSSDFQSGSFFGGGCSWQARHKSRFSFLSSGAPPSVAVGQREQSKWSIWQRCECVFGLGNSVRASSDVAHLLLCRWSIGFFSSPRLLFSLQWNVRVLRHNCFFRVKSRKCRNKSVPCKAVDFGRVYSNISVFYNFFRLPECWTTASLFVIWRVHPGWLEKTNVKHKTSLSAFA